jgi:hypothetical protein
MDKLSVWWNSSGVSTHLIRGILSEPGVRARLGPRRDRQHINFDDGNVTLCFHHHRHMQACPPKLANHLIGHHVFSPIFQKWVLPFASSKGGVTCGCGAVEFLSHELKSTRSLVTKHNFTICLHGLFRLASGWRSQLVTWRRFSQQLYQQIVRYLPRTGGKGATPTGPLPLATGGPPRRVLPRLVSPTGGSRHD